jgi:hypothetical protein
MELSDDIEEDLAKLEQVIRLVDANGDGKIDGDELKAAEHASNLVGLDADRAAVLLQMHNTNCLYKASGSKDKRGEGNIAHYTDKSLAEREAVKNDPGLIAELIRWWGSVLSEIDHNRSEELDEKEYRTLYNCIINAAVHESLIDPMSANEIEDAFQRDWEADNHGDGSVSQAE